MKDIYDMLFNKRAKRTSDGATPSNDSAPDNPYIAARRECRQQAKSQGLKDEGEIKTFVKNCLAKGGK